MTLRTYVVARILLTIPMIFILLTAVFVIMRVLPGDPVAMHFDKMASPATVEQMRVQLGMNKPIYMQYVDYIVGLFQGNLGKSMQDNSPVAQEIFSAFPATLELAICAMLVAVLVGIFLGVQASKSYNKPKDHAIRLFSIVTYAIPVFFLGMIFQMVFGVWLHWLPTGGRIAPGMEPTGLTLGSVHIQTGLYTVDSLLAGNISEFALSVEYLLLPSLTLGLVLSGIFVRLTRTNMFETMRLDFVTAAKARGLKDETVTYGYALRNAFLPVLTMTGLQFALLLGGAILTETTFSWPGLGTYLVSRINFRDYTAIQGTVVVFGIFVSLVSLAVDLLYAYLDPRIRL
ncbi:MAG: ABC transporter permease [Candidatus Bathyarchaeia archaeon]